MKLTGLAAAAALMLSAAWGSAYADDIGVIRNTHVGSGAQTGGARCVVFDLVHTDGTDSRRYAIEIFTPGDTAFSQSVFANEGKVMSLTPGSLTKCGSDDGGDGFPGFTNLNGPF